MWMCESWIYVELLNISELPLKFKGDPIYYYFRQDTIYTLFIFNFFSFLKGSDDGVYYSELLGFRTLSIVRYSRN
jgi:hypothetical protein